MGDGTGIAWTDATWNPVRGCSRVSRGCEHCYAESVARRFSGPGMPYEGLVRLDAAGKAKAQWNGTVRLVSGHLADPLRWKRPRRIFVNSMSDLFHEALPFETIAAVFAVMEDCPQHTFQVLTKRPKRARDFFKWVSAMVEIEAVESAGTSTESDVVQDALRSVRPHVYLNDGAGADWPLPNVHLGVSVEDQAAADERIPVLLDTPAVARWVSYEPALGPVDFWPFFSTLDANSEWSGPRCNPDGSAALGWIVVGGESGPGARPFDLAWARSTVEQCREAGVACFVKQLGARPVGGWDDLPVSLRAIGSQLSPSALGGRFDLRGRFEDSKGGDPAEWPADLRVREFPEAMP